MTWLNTIYNSEFFFSKTYNEISFVNYYLSLSTFIFLFFLNSLQNYQLFYINSFIVIIIKDWTSFIINVTGKCYKLTIILKTVLQYLFTQIIEINNAD